MNDPKPPQKSGPKPDNDDKNIAPASPNERAGTGRRPDARYIAACAIQDVVQNQDQLENALSSQPGFAYLESRDKAFARLLSATVFRRFGQIDRVLGQFLKRKPPAFVMSVLRMSTASLLFLKTPPHAAIDEAVELVKRRKATAGFSGLVNAVLRQVDQKGRILLASIPPHVNVPGWIYKVWEKSYGGAEARRMAQVLTQEPPLDLTVKADAPGWAERLGGEAIYAQTVRLTSAGKPTKLEGFGDGAWWIQDVASTLPVLSLGDVAGQNVLDLCAAPGGKTMQLAAAGANVTALDQSPARLERLSDNLARTGLQAEIIEADLLSWDSSGAVYDTVLLDAPCTATGTYRRHPDVLYNKTPKQLAALVRLQKQMLSVAARCVKSGGQLIYCTCSLQPEEGERQIDYFLKNYPDFKVNAINMPQFETLLTSQGYLRVKPSFWREMGSLDGFFIASMKKTW